MYSTGKLRDYAGIILGNGRIVVMKAGQGVGPNNIF